MQAPKHIEKTAKQGSSFVDEDNQRRINTDHLDAPRPPDGGSDATSQHPDKVYLTKDGTNRLKMEQWLAENKSVAATSHTGAPFSLAFGIVDSDAQYSAQIQKKVQQSVQSILQRYPRRRDIRVMIGHHSDIRFGGSTDDLTGDLHEFSRRVQAQSIGGLLGYYHPKGLTLPSGPIRASITNTLKEMMDRIPVAPHQIDTATKNLLLRNACAAAPDSPDVILPSLGTITAKAEKSQSRGDITFSLRNLAISGAEDQSLQITPYSLHIFLDVSAIRDDIPVQASKAGFPISVQDNLLKSINEVRRARKDSEVSEQMVSQAIEAMKYIVSSLSVARGSKKELAQYK